MVVAFVMLVRKDQFQALMGDIVSSKGLLAVTGMISLVAGLAIAISHTIWVFDWRGVITLIGYIAIIQGFIRLAFPEFVQRMGRNLGNTGYLIIFVIIAVIGLFLTYNGFMM